MIENMNTKLIVTKKSISAEQKFVQFFANKMTTKNPIHPAPGDEPMYMHIYINKYFGDATKKSQHFLHTHMYGLHGKYFFSYVTV
jgi:hypothetical protein